MNGIRFPWFAIPALILGLALGLFYAWGISPVRVVDAAPSALRADFKDQYRALIAAAYAANRDLARASARLALLGDADAYAALSGQAQRTLSSGDSLQSFQLAQLASALQGTAPTLPPPAPTSFSIPTSTIPPSTPGTIIPMDTLSPIETENPDLHYTPTPRPTQTPVPLPGAPFSLMSQETVCDEALIAGLLQVVTITSARWQIPGIELILSWAGGEEHFFTGFKPELGNGYADAILSPNVLYSLRAADGGDIAIDLSAPTCQSTNGGTYFGGLKIIFKRP